MIILQHDRRLPQAAHSFAPTVHYHGGAAVNGGIGPTGEFKMGAVTFIHNGQHSLVPRQSRRRTQIPAKTVNSGIHKHHRAGAVILPHRLFHRLRSGPQRNAKTGMEKHRQPYRLRPGQSDSVPNGLGRVPRHQYFISRAAACHQGGLQTHGGTVQQIVGVSGIIQPRHQFLAATNLSFRAARVIQLLIGRQIITAEAAPFLHNSVRL